MDFGTLIGSLGYPAVALGLLLEGEAVLVAAGFAANLGYFEIGAILGLATIASFANDQTCFWLGRFAGPRLMERFPRLRGGIERVQPMVERHPAKLVVSLRFLFGLRVVGPLALGMTPASTMSAGRFLILSLVGAVLWALLGGGLGYFFGSAFSLLVDDVQGWPLAIPMLLVATAAMAWAIRARAQRSRRLARS
jgi:membrane protein DedA with SNARE-associated domain